MFGRRRAAQNATSPEVASSDPAVNLTSVATPAADPSSETPWRTPTWEELVEEHSDMVYRVALRLTGDRHDAEDLTQDVFVRAFRSIHEFEPGTLTGWLRRITTNLFLDQARRKQRIRFDPMAEAQERLAFVGPGPAQTAIEATLDHDIARALADLPPDVRVAVVLCDIEGLSYDAIAEITDSSLASVRSRIQRGRAKLREQLAHRRPHPGHDHVMGAPDERPGQARSIEPDAMLDEVLRR